MDDFENTHRPPEAVFRVGITGARSLQQDRLSPLAHKLDATLRFIQHAAFTGLQHKGTARLRFLSPLAPGSDRLAARAALASGFELCVPMPFTQAEYEEDFTGTDRSRPEIVQRNRNEDLAEFRELLAQSSERIELDGSHSGGMASLSYLAVGRFVARHTDLLIAIWDGKPRKGVGGTAEIVCFAATNNTPIWWINALEEVEPRWIEDLQDLRDPPRVQSGKNSPWDCLRKYIESVLIVPRPISSQWEGPSRL